MNKYSELIYALNSVDTSGMCPCEKEALCRDKDCIVSQAADAIEALSRMVEILERDIEASKGMSGVSIDLTKTNATG